MNGDSLIKRNSLSGNRLRNRSVTGAKIKVGSLGMVPSATHATSADTATSATNATNATTATSAGSAPIAKLTYVTTPFTVPGDDTVNTGAATCPSGTNVTGGGASIDDTDSGAVIASYPAGKTGLERRVPGRQRNPGHGDRLRDLRAGGGHRSVNPL